MVTAPQRQFWFDSVRACRALSLMDRNVATTIGFAVHVGSSAWAISYKMIGDRSVCSENTAARSVKRLEESGWVKVQHTGGRRANTFTLRLPPPLQFPDDDERVEFGPIRSDKTDDAGKIAALSVEKSNAHTANEPHHNYVRVGGDGDSPITPIAVVGLNIHQHHHDCGGEANEQHRQMAPPTPPELRGTKRRKERITYSPFDAQATTEGVSFNPSGASSKQPASALTLVFVEHGTKAGRAWEQHWLKTKRKRPPWQCMPGQDFKRGWFFPSEFPQMTPYEGYQQL